MTTAQKSAATAKRATAVTPAKKAKPVATEQRQSKPHEIVLSTVVQNAVGIMSWSKFAGEADLQELCTDLDKRVDKIKGGDMSSVEAMLFGQAKVLETMFTSLARRAANNEGLKQFQCNLTLALKAQAQCRATLEALAEIKNPRPVQFVKQANMTTGPQQVNNGNAAGFREQYAKAHTGAGNNPNEQSKLLKADNGNYLDTRAQGTASRVNPHMATVG
jgi:hypothetical protein